MFRRDWKRKPISGQKVTFVEVRAETSRVIGTADDKTASITSAPGPGRGGRKIVAAVEQDEHLADRLRALAAPIGRVGGRDDRPPNPDIYRRVSRRGALARRSSRRAAAAALAGPPARAVQPAASSPVHLPVWRDTVGGELVNFLDIFLNP